MIFFIDTPLHPFPRIREGILVFIFFEFYIEHVVYRRTLTSFPNLTSYTIYQFNQLTTLTIYQARQKTFFAREYRSVVVAPSDSHQGSTEIQPEHHSI